MKSLLASISGIRLDGNIGVVVLLLMMFMGAYFHATHTGEAAAVLLFSRLIDLAWNTIMVLMKTNAPQRSGQRATDRPDSGQAAV